MYYSLQHLLAILFRIRLLSIAFSHPQVFLSSARSARMFFGRSRTPDALSADSSCGSMSLPVSLHSFDASWTTTRKLRRLLAPIVSETIGAIFAEY